jgi:hypothetical protein
VISLFLGGWTCLKIFLLLSSKYMFVLNSGKEIEQPHFERLTIHSLLQINICCLEMIQGILEIVLLCLFFPFVFLFTSFVNSFVYLFYLNCCRVSTVVQNDEPQRTPRTFYSAEYHPSPRLSNESIGQCPPSVQVFRPDFNSSMDPSFFGRKYMLLLIILFFNN